MEGQPRTLAQSEQVKTPEQIKQQIIFCVGTLEQFGEEFQELQYDLVPEEVDFYGDPEILDALNQKHVGELSFVISAVNEAPKSSKEYANCTGVVAVGKDKITKRNISLLSHQHPGTIVDEHSQEFTRDLSDRLEELKERSEEGSIDVAIFGGRAEGKHKELSDEELEVEYYKAVSLLGDVIHNSIGVDATVLLGPNVRHGFGNSFEDLNVRVMFDTERRRLYMIRPRQIKQGLSHDATHSDPSKVDPGTDLTFPVSKINEMKKSWESDRSS